MHKAAQHLLGEKDFSAFRASGCQSKTPVREIFEAKVSKNGNLIFFKILRERNLWKKFILLYFLLFFWPNLNIFFIVFMENGKRRKGREGEDEGRGRGWRC